MTLDWTLAPVALAVRGEHRRTGAKLDRRAVPVERGERLQDVRERWKPE